LILLLGVLASFVFFEYSISFTAIMILILLGSIQFVSLLYIFFNRYRKRTLLMKERIKIYIGMILFAYFLIGMYLQYYPKLGDNQIASILLLHIPIMYYFAKYIFSKISEKSGSSIIVVNGES